MHVAQTVPIILLSAAVLTPAPEIPKNTLLSVATVSSRIRSLQDPSATMNTQPAALKKQLATFRQVIRQYVLRQIDTDASISESALQERLTKVFGPETNAPLPRVFAEPWGTQSTSRVFVISYGWFGFYGTNGSQTILESYIWKADAGVHPGTGTVLSAFNGFWTQTEQICRFTEPLGYWLLVSGTVGGASGRLLTGSASVIEIGPAQTRTIWNSPPKIGNVAAYTPPMSNRWEIEYSIVNSFYGGQPNPRFLDIFQIDYSIRAFRRIVHQAIQ